MFKELVKKLSTSSSEENMLKLIDHSKFNFLEIEEIADLARILAMSGDCISPPEGELYGDIPSTGGPGSLSTMLCPLMLKELGFVVPKLSVPGRPAGGVDVLYQIENYKIDYQTAEIIECLEQNRYCHFLVGSNHAPLDNLLFNFRSKIGAKANTALVIASILSKKIAMGLNFAGLDIRISKFGNFGIDWRDATTNGNRFIEVAAYLGIKATCFLNDFDILPQPYIGRGESLLAIHEILYGNASGSLKKHFHQCIDMAVEFSSGQIPQINLKRIARHFEDNLIAQKSSVDFFFKKVEIVKQNHLYYIESPATGFLKIDIQILRNSILWGQNIHISKNDRFPDPCGVVFFKEFNDFVNKGDIILTYRVDKRLNKKFKELLLSCVTISERYQQSLNYKIIN